MTAEAPVCLQPARTGASPAHDTFRRAGIMNGVPEEIDHATAGMATDGEGEEAAAVALLQ